MAKFILHNEQIINTDHIITAYVAPVDDVYATFIVLPDDRRIACRADTRSEALLLLHKLWNDLVHNG